jgi:hypothetical protein
MTGQEPTGRLGAPIARLVRDAFQTTHTVVLVRLVQLTFLLQLFVFYFYFSVKQIRLEKTIGFLAIFLFRLKNVQILKTSILIYSKNVQMFIFKKCIF